MARKLIIDADPGIGDAFAIALATLDPDIDLIAITATAGCVSGQIATRNILAISESVDPMKWPRLGCSTADRPSFPNAEECHFSDPLRLNGPNGVGRVELPFSKLHNQHESAKVIVDLVKQHPHEVTVLTLGPLTNLELAIELAPEVLELMQGIVIQGGAISLGGDATPASEFNFYANADAAWRVLRAPTAKTLVPLEAANQVVLTFDGFNRLKQLKGNRLHFVFEDLLPFALRAHHEQLGLEGLPLREVAALAAITQDRFFKSRPMVVEIETDGLETRGASVADLRRGISRQPNVEVVQSVEVQGVLDYITQLVKRS